MSSTEDRRGFLALALTGIAVPALAQPATEASGSAPCSTDIEAAVREARAKARESETRSRAAYGQALVARFGSTVVETIRDHTIDETRKRTEGRKLDSRGLGAVKSLLWDRLDPADFTTELVERTPSRMEFRVTRCALADSMREQGAGELGFAYYCAWDLGFCQGLNPRIRFTRTQTLMQGHPCCNHTYELEPDQG